MITIKSRSDLEKLREAGRVAAQALELAGKSIHPGMTTYQLDKILHDFIVHSGATPPCFSDTAGFPQVRVSPSMKKSFTAFQVGIV